MNRIIPKRNCKGSADLFVDHTSRPVPSALIIALALVISLGAITVCAYVVFVRIPTDLANNALHTAESAADNVIARLKNAFDIDPKITLEGRTIVAPPKDKLELVTVEQPLTGTYTYVGSFLGSQKKITLQGSFLAKAGFDLDDRFTIDIQKEPIRVSTTLPPPKLISFEMKSYHVEETPGWWNQINDTDRDNAVAWMLESARKSALEQGLLQRAQDSLELRIQRAVTGALAPTEFHILQKDKPASPKLLIKTALPGG